MAWVNDYKNAACIVEEGLTVTYSRRKISGSWGWVSLNMSGSWSYMNEYHRYATKSFRYVGMTYDAAKACRDAMIDYFTRKIKIDVWDGSATNGTWVTKDGGELLMADISLTRGDADEWSVHVRVSEDDTRYTLPDQPFTAESQFVFEQSRKYWTDGNGVADETEKNGEQ